eukprot:gnl/MRDRNA2_/MRDRNA2_93757_c0_seq1.p1 gnl/MRDRNA2_/MRDRNA2_93757_c0~~gnl/MRDRNA2_/MRDRNA2_93757_c0_seq1.p1  ORF type:complete len:606 (+),score=135.39 gnl/MRDRNA2_/MRDRNA2_93757_c0_seq1:75-1892(+)
MAEGLVSVPNENGQELGVSKSISLLARGFQRIEDGLAAHCDDVQALATRLDERIDSLASTFETSLRRTCEVEEKMATFDIAVRESIKADARELLKEKFGGSFAQDVHDAKAIATRLQSFDISLSKKADASPVEHLLDQYAGLLGSTSLTKTEVAVLTARFDKLENHLCATQTGICTLTQLMEAVHPLKVQLEDQNAALLSKANALDLSSLSTTVQGLCKQVHKVEAPPVDTPKTFPRHHDVAGRRIQTGVRQDVPAQDVMQKRHRQQKAVQGDHEEDRSVSGELEEIRSNIELLNSTLEQKAASAEMYKLSATLQTLSDSLDREVEQKADYKIKSIQASITDRFSRYEEKSDRDIHKLRTEIRNSCELELTKLRNHVDGLNAKWRGKVDSLGDTIFSKVDLGQIEQLSKNLIASFENQMKEFDKELHATKDLLEQTAERVTQVEKKVQVQTMSLDDMSKVCNENQEMLELTCLYTALPPTRDNNCGKDDEQDTATRRKLRRQDLDDLIARVACKADSLTVEALRAAIERINEFLMSRFPQFRAPQLAGPSKYFTGSMSAYKGEFKSAGPRRVQGREEPRPFTFSDSGSEVPASNFKMAPRLQQSN